MKIDNNTVSNYHAQYFDVTSQHWHPSSAQFAGADNLITAVNEGWEFEDTVILRPYWYAGQRRVDVFYFKLSRSGEQMTMPVINNPYVERLITTHNIRVIKKDQEESTTS